MVRGSHMSIKISVIGAGSSVFSLSMVKDICVTKSLKGCTVCFMDIDEGRLAAAYSLCERYAAEMGLKIKLEKTTDRLTALKNADFVINTALAVPYDLWKKGWAIASELGYRYGGSLHVMHDEAFWINHAQFQLMESVYLDMLDICPDAWYVMVLNPVLAGMTMMKRKYPNGKIVGLCHGYNGVYHVADVLGLKREDIGFEVSGVNHMIFLNHFTHKGKDAFPLLDGWIKEKSAEYHKTCKMSDGMGPKAVDIYKKYGVFPIGDTGNPGGGSWGWWYHTDRQTEAGWREDPTWWFDEIYFGANARIVAEIAEVARDTSIKVTEKYPPAKTGESMIKLIESIAFDIPRVLITNIQNDGEYVRGIPRDFEVEIPTLVSAKGIQGIRTKELPKPIISYILRDRVAPVEMELAAFQQKDYGLLLSMIMMDPWTKSEAQARCLLDRILALPGLENMKRHYLG